jgi:C-terminal processing protease CtpA/Prc
VTALQRPLCGLALAAARLERSPVEPLRCRHGGAAALLQEPDDEAERRTLDPGAFSGIYVEDARESLEAMTGEAEGVRVARVVENSPGASAGVEPGDLLLEVDDGSARTALHWPSEWRGIELAHSGGTRLGLVLERLGNEREVELVLEDRVVPAARTSALRLREEEHVGIAVRAPTEVEAREAGLAPGAGAVVVGLSRASPWRAAGVTFGDLLVAVDGTALAGPEALLELIRAAPADASFDLRVRRGSEELELAAPTSRRARELQSVSIPLILSYESGGGRTLFSVLQCIVRWRSTQAARGGCASAGFPSARATKIV